MGRQRGDQVLHNRGHRSEGDIDAAGHQHHEQAEGKDAAHRIAFAEIEQVLHR